MDIGFSFSEMKICPQMCPQRVRPAPVCRESAPWCPHAELMRTRSTFTFPASCSPNRSLFPRPATGASAGGELPVQLTPPRVPKGGASHRFSLASNQRAAFSCTWCNRSMPFPARHDLPYPTASRRPGMGSRWLRWQSSGQVRPIAVSNDPPHFLVRCIGLSAGLWQFEAPDARFWPPVRPLLRPALRRL